MDAVSDAMDATSAASNAKTSASDATAVSVNLILYVGLVPHRANLWDLLTTENWPTLTAADASGHIRDISGGLGAYYYATSTDGLPWLLEVQ